MMREESTDTPGLKDGPTEAVKSENRTLRKLRRDKTTLAALGLIIGLVLVVLLAPWLAPFSEEHINLQELLLAPSWAHPLGTDHLGRDVLSRILYGSQISVLVAVLSTLGAATIGTVWGTTAAYYGRWFDEISTRIFDVMFAFPYIVLAMALVALIGPGTINIIFVIAIVRIPMFARLVRASALTIKEADFIHAASALGARDYSIILKHLVPNLLGPVLVMGSLTMATAINTEAALSFLGLGVTPPQSSWGTVLSDGRDYLWQAPWISTFAGIAITIAILGFNLLGDGLRDLLDPRLRS
ncbi:MAG: ABC transporter permease [Truepera sp.]|jgi:peptide/nickel transport system permease protein|nr:ABC transporter permease [Truepera sp.]